MEHHTDRYRSVPAPRNSRWVFGGITALSFVVVFLGMFVARSQFRAAALGASPAVPTLIELQPMRFAESREVSVPLPFDPRKLRNADRIESSCGCITLVDRAQALATGIARLAILPKSADRPPDTEISVLDRSGATLAAVRVRSPIVPPFRGWPAAAAAEWTGSDHTIEVNPEYLDFIHDIRVVGEGRPSISIWNARQGGAVVPKEFLANNAEIVVEFGPDLVRWSGPISLVPIPSAHEGRLR